MFLDGGLTYTNLLGFIAVWLLAFATLAREFHVVRFNSGNDMTLIDGKSLREELVALVKARAANVDPSDRHVALNRLTGDVNQLRIGASKESALGLEESMKVGSQRLSFSMGAASEGVERIEKEFQTAVNVAREAHARAADEATRRDAAERLKNAENDFECLQYVLHSRAGSSDTVFANGNLKRDCDKGGNVRDDRLTFDGLGMQLQDFCNHPSARTAKLLTAHVVALRLYTTAAFVRLNSPLRDEDPNRPPHPFPVTMSYINAGISKLRAVGVKDGGLAKEDFWRGMRSLSFSDVRDQFLKEGGTERAPMSTTADLAIAVQYALSTHALLFRIKTTSFMQRGADLTFLSAFPDEVEYLYNPLTFLRPTGKVVEIEISQKDDVPELMVEAVNFTVVEVEPFMP